MPYRDNLRSADTGSQYDAEQTTAQERYGVGQKDVVLHWPHY
jgi:hypothetical protein